MLRSRRISTILFTSFGVVVLFMFILTAGNLIARKLMLENYTNLSDGILYRQLILTKIERDYYILKGFTENVIQFDGSINTDAYREKITLLSDEISENFGNAFLSLENDTLKNLVDENGEAFEKQSMSNIEKVIKDEFVSKAIMLIDAPKGQQQEIRMELEQAGTNIKNTLEEYLNFIENKAKTIESTLIENSGGFTVLIISISLSIIILGIMLSIISVKAIKSQIKPISTATNEVREGRFNVNLTTNATNEMGKLSNDIGNVVNIFQSMLDEINRVAREFESGHLSSKIDISMFEGEYRNTAISINDLLAGLVGDIRDILKCMNSFSRGDFNVNVKQYEGEKAIINETVDRISFNLRAVNFEINEISKQASDGNLDIEICLEKYEGDWQAIMQSLNHLVTAVRNPVKEVLETLEAVSKADFSVRINTSYSGQFELMKNSLNFTVSTISDYIKDISDVLNQIANQNLSVKIEKEYIGDFVVVKRDLNTMIDIFSKLISDFNDSAVSLAISSKQISDNNNTLAQGSADQKAYIAELNSAIVEVSNKNNENVETAKSASDLSKEIYEFGLVGKEKMDQMLVSMEKIQEVSNSVLGVINVIDNITFQINLLALNAAVEAARAGQHGKGFAVVADEVRSLAERSKAAAMETTGYVNQTIDSIKDGAKVSSETADAINLILINLDKISGTIQKVAKTSEEQDSSMAMVGNELTQIVEIANQNTATSEENASSSEELANQAETLKQMLSKFVV